MALPVKTQANQKIIMRKKQKALYQPYPKGTFEYDLFRVINAQGLPDVVLSQMCGLSGSAICNWRTKLRRPRDLPTIQKILSRCGYRLKIEAKDEQDLED
jgi:hypothetical protein